MFVNEGGLDNTVPPSSRLVFIVDVYQLGKQTIAK